MSEEQVLDIQGDDYMNSPRLTPREKAAVLWAEHVAKNTAKDRDDVFEEVSKQFSEPEIVELTLVCSFRNMRTRFHDSLQLDLEDPTDAAPGGKPPKVDPNRLKAYLQRILDDWPDELPTPNPD